MRRVERMRTQLRRAARIGSSVLAALHPVLEHLQRHRAVVLGRFGDGLVVAFLDPGLVRRRRCRAPASATSARARPDAAVGRR